jgi:hypothetical protein
MLGSFLHKLRYYQSEVGEKYPSVDESDLHWLRQREKHRLNASDSVKFEGQSCVYLHPKVEDVLVENLRCLKVLSGQGVPVVKYLSKDCVPCVKKHMKQGKGEYEFGQMPLKNLFCRGAPVMMTANLCTEWELFNGSMGTVVDIYLHMTGCCLQMEGSLQMLYLWRCQPIVVLSWLLATVISFLLVQGCFQEICGHGCSRVQFPFRFCWAITVHKSQGMTIRCDQYIKGARVHLGAVETDKWAAGAAFQVTVVQLSRETEIGALCLEGPVDLDQFTMWSAGKQAVESEDGRLFQMHLKTLEREPWLVDKTGFQMMVNQCLECPG